MHALYSSSIQKVEVEGWSVESLRPAMPHRETVSQREEGRNEKRNLKGWLGDMCVRFWCLFLLLYVLEAFCSV